MSASLANQWLPTVRSIVFCAEPCRCSTPYSPKPPPCARLRCSQEVAVVYTGCRRTQTPKRGQ
eukprot:1187008-Prorocentrum_minimum.AAC.3